MAGFVQAIALDLDGTLTLDGRLDEEVVRSLDECADTGIRVVVVTGRIRSELGREFPTLAEHVDALVYENGAVVEIAGHRRSCAAPVESELITALADRGVDVRMGEVIVAGRAADAKIVAEEISRLGLDTQVVRNRSELMVLPAGVSKASGLRTALADLKTSIHNTVAVGDAENDLSMLESAEVGVAVANAVGSVRRHADIVLDQEGGAGVSALLQGPLLGGSLDEVGWRHRVSIGRRPNGEDVSIPACRANIVIRGESGTGKSHLAGLLAERWIESGYTVLVIDPEGDHADLGHMRGVVVIDGAQPGHQAEVVEALALPDISIVLDLSALDHAGATTCIQSITPDLEDLRSRQGLPHWIIVDEAHGSFCDDGLVAHLLRPTESGFCFVTYQPDRLCAGALQAADITIVCGSGREGGQRVSTISRRWDDDEVAFIPDARITRHVRHRHKYGLSSFPASKRFQFRSATEQVIGTADDLDTFVNLLATAPPESVEYHARRSDFSRWTAQVLQDRQLARLAAAAENKLTARHATALSRFREEILSEVRERYLDNEALPDAAGKPN
jgi:hydroxymethylpyrimidine pyrophosphatase-like HAD family hydrolase